ncbi:MAG TPA: hypothetical protein VLS89_08510 [Candidatus Nanopelagicales bacterium]|nr:hypothetical protein [Candidatus Nanopelagicales bacterium]
MRFSVSNVRCLSRSAIVAVFALAALAGQAGCGEAPPPPPADPAAAAEQARIDASRKKIDEAALAIDEKRYAEAREMLDEARKLNIESHRFEIDEQTEKLDRREAKLWANEVSEQLDEKQCVEAFGELAKQIEERDSKAFTEELRKLVEAQAVACASGKLDELAGAGKFAEARAFLEAEATREVLGEAPWKKLSVELEGTNTEALAGQLAEDIKAARWGVAVEKVEAAQKRGDATQGIAQSVLARVRAAATPVLTAEAGKAVGTRDAADALKEVDAMIAKLGWQALSEGAAELARDRALPEELGRKRSALAAWVESQRLKMKPLKKWEKRWAHGKVAVSPAASAEGASKRDLRPAAEVWVLGQTKDLALITEVAPGAAPLNEALEVAIGWVPRKRLAGESTADWVPPNDQLEGERVWAPLRDKPTALELGIVDAVKGNDVFVKRIADDVVVKLSRSQLRNGRLDKGTKVLTLCDEDNQPATVFEHIQGTRVARVQCEGGLQKEQPLASLRSRPDLLPASK